MIDIYDRCFIFRSHKMSTIWSRHYQPGMKLSDESDKSSLYVKFLIHLEDSEVSKFNIKVKRNQLPLSKLATNSFKVLRAFCESDISGMMQFDIIKGGRTLYLTNEDDLLRMKLILQK